MPTRSFFLLPLFFTFVFILPQPSLGSENKTAMPPARVMTASFSQRMVAPKIMLTGSVVAELDSRVAAEISGQVLTAPPQEGKLVTKGSIICRLDSELLEKSLSIAEREISESEVILEKAALDFERVKPVFESQATSRQAYDDRLYRLKEVKAKLAVARARKEFLEVEIKRKTIRAPFTGVVAQRLTEVGEWVAVGDPICRLIDLQRLAAEIPVPARYLPYLGKDEKINLRIPALQEDVEGVFNRLIPTGDRKARTFPLRLNLPAAAGLLPGYDLEAQIPSAPAVKSTLVPRDAIVRRGESATIVVVKDNQAEIVPVRVTGYDHNDAIISFLSPAPELTAPVVIRGNERLRPGQVVAITKAAEKKP